MNIAVRIGARTSAGKTKDAAVSAVAPPRLCGGWCPSMASTNLAPPTSQESEAPCSHRRHDGLAAPLRPSIRRRRAGLILAAPISRPRDLLRGAHGCMPKRQLYCQPCATLCTSAEQLGANLRDYVCHVYLRLCVGGFAGFGGATIARRPAQGVFSPTWPPDGGTSTGIAPSCTRRAFRTTILWHAERSNLPGAATALALQSAA